MVSSILSVVNISTVQCLVVRAGVCLALVSKWLLVLQVSCQIPMVVHVGIFIMDAIQSDPSIWYKDPHYQSQKLVIEPVWTSHSSLSSPMAIIIDAIDECEDNNLIQDITTLLSVVQTQSFRPPSIFTLRVVQDPTFWIPWRHSEFPNLITFFNHRSRTRSTTFVHIYSSPQPTYTYLKTPKRPRNQHPHAHYRLARSKSLPQQLADCPIHWEFEMGFEVVLLLSTRSETTQVRQSIRIHPPIPTRNIYLVSNLWLWNDVIIYLLHC